MSSEDQAQETVRAEAQRRMREQREQVGLTVVEQARFIEGFEQGASWQEEQHAERIRDLGVHSDRLRAECDRTRHRFDVERERAEADEAKLAAVRALAEEAMADIPADPGNETARHIGRTLLAVLDMTETT